MKDILINILSGLNKHPSLIIDLITLCEENKEIKQNILESNFIDSLPFLLLSDYLKETIDLLVIVTEDLFHNYFYDKKFLFFVTDKIYECILLLKERYENEEGLSEMNSNFTEENIKLSEKNEEENDKSIDSKNLTNASNSENLIEEENSFKPKKYDENFLINLLKLIRNLVKNDEKKIIYELFYNLGLFYLLNNLNFPLIEEIYNLVYENVLELKEINLTKNNLTTKDEGIIEYERKHFGSKIVLKKRNLVERIKVNLNYRKGNEIFVKLINNETVLYKNVLIYSLSLPGTDRTSVFFNDRFINNLMEDERNTRQLLLIFNKIDELKMYSLFHKLDLSLISKFKERNFETLDLFYLITKLTKEVKNENQVNTFITIQDISLLFDFLKYDVNTFLGNSFTDRMLFLINECLEMFDRKFFCKISHLIILSTLKNEIGKKVMRIIMDFLKEDTLNFGRILFTTKEKKKKLEVKKKKGEKKFDFIKQTQEVSQIKKENNSEIEGYNFDLEKECEEDFDLPKQTQEGSQIKKENNLEVESYNFDLENGCEEDFDLPKQTQEVSQIKKENNSEIEGYNFDLEKECEEDFDLQDENLENFDIFKTYQNSDS